MISKEVRLSYVNLLQPAENLSGDLKYGCRVLVDKTDKDALAEFEAATERAIKVGLEKGKFSKAQVGSPKFKRPLRDGDEELALEIVKSPEHKGQIFFNCSSDSPVGMVNITGMPLTTDLEVYSGMYARLDINFYPFNRGGQFGVAVGINNVLKTRDGDRLDNRQNAQDAFAKYFKTEDDAEMK